MRILFVNVTPLKFNVRTPYNEPLGGTESAICYLAVALARKGHEVTVASASNGNGVIDNVNHRNIGQINGLVIDVCITVNIPATAIELKRLYPKAAHYLWCHMMPEQKAIEKIGEFKDCVVYLTDEQRVLCERNFGTSHSCVIGNGYSPSLDHERTGYSMVGSSGMDKNGRSIFTSAPYRGLNCLGGYYLAYRPPFEVDVFSSMRVYQDQGYENILEWVKNIPGIKLHEPVGQKKLAEYLLSAEWMLYPCLFNETYSISVLDALAAGCKVVTTDLAVIDEHKKYMSIVDTHEMMNINDLLAKFKEALNYDWDVEGQMDHVRKTSSWDKRAGQWEELFGIMNSTLTHQEDLQ